MSESKASGWDDKGNPFRSALRTVEFRGRATGIYASYKSAQARALAMSLAGQDDEMIKQKLWEPHHTWDGQQMYELCISLRGFYLKVRHVARIKRHSHSSCMSASRRQGSSSGLGGTLCRSKCAASYRACTTW
jgi:hypothetical protein